MKYDPLALKKKLPELRGGKKKKDSKVLGTNLKDL